ncbi:mRNA interferase EndoA [archaeon BMS3Abin17]|nr:mRNA interferase EndoA [archaeon BMS3Abin17]HDZ61419.1 type II toxin-antitoxin system PemK/MazF family toxin [Candidatus Pacearchaeota archaeon]
MVAKILRGDIFLVNFEPVKGVEQGKIRPALIIQNNISNKFSPLTIVAPITSKVYEKEYPTNVILSKSDSNLEKDSVVLLNQIRTIDKRRIIKKLSHLDNLIMNKVDLAIKISLGLE